MYWAVGKLLQKVTCILEGRAKEEHEPMGLHVCVHASVYTCVQRLSVCIYKYAWTDFKAGRRKERGRGVLSEGWGTKTKGCHFI